MSSGVEGGELLLPPDRQSRRPQRKRRQWHETLLQEDNQAYSPSRADQHVAPTRPVPHISPVSVVRDQIPHPAYSH